MSARPVKTPAGKLQIRNTLKTQNIDGRHMKKSAVVMNVAKNVPYLTGEGLVKYQPKV
jgi:hypothetical protein